MITALLAGLVIAVMAVCAAIVLAWLLILLLMAVGSWLS